MYKSLIALLYIATYRGGLIMKGTSVIYAWNIDNKGVHLCLEH